VQTDFNMVLVSEDERFLAALSHLAIFASFVMGPLCAIIPGYLWYREHQRGARGSAFVTFHAAQATLYQGLGVAAFMAAAFMAFLLCLVFVGLLLIPIVIVGGVALYVYALFVGVKVWQGENLKYFVIGDELTGRLAR